MTTDLSIDSSILLDVIKGVLHKSAHAAVWGVVAVDDVLFAQWDQLARLIEGLALQRSGCAESPARATLCLILDRGNVTLFNGDILLARANVRWKVNLIVRTPVCTQKSFLIIDVDV